MTDVFLMCPKKPTDPLDVPTLFSRLYVDMSLTVFSETFSGQTVGGNIVRRGVD
jgi:hypothetical protein